MTPQGYSVGGATCDVANPEDVNATIDHVIATFGAVDVLVNNTSVSWLAAAEDMLIDKWRAVLDTNLTSAFELGGEVGAVQYPREGDFVWVFLVSHGRRRVGVRLVAGASNYIDLHIRNSNL